jgi:hypothetical protein
MTSFHSTTIDKRFPIGHGKRSQYIPIHRPGVIRTPHPDSGLILDVQITGEPTALKVDRVSYVSLSAPFYVSAKHLGDIGKGTARLTFNSLKLLVESINRGCPRGWSAFPKVPVPQERSLTTALKARAFEKISSEAFSGSLRSTSSPPPASTSFSSGSPPMSFACALASGANWRSVPASA